MRNQIFEIKAISDSGAFEGIASVYGNVDSYGDIVMPGAFKKTIAERGANIPVLAEHSETIGKGSVTDEGTHLAIKGQILTTIQRGKDYVELAKAGIVKGLSIGYKTIKDEWDSKDQVRRLMEVKLYEVSFVTFPANEMAFITSVKSENNQASAFAAINAFIQEIKAGRTLSAATRAKITATLESLSALLAESDDTDEAAKSKAPEPPPHSWDMAAILREMRASGALT